MNRFNTNIIKNYIEAHKEEICCVLCGYNETWISSASAVFCNGSYVRELNGLNGRIPDGTERTPYMEVIFNDGTICFLYCF